MQAFLKEFRVMGQICHEGMDESGILPKARYAMIVFHLSGVAGCRGGGRYKPPSGSRAETWWGSRGQSPWKHQRSCSTLYQKMPPKKHFLGTFLSVCCIQIERKNSFKLKKFMCKANNSTSCSVNILKRIS